MAVDLATLAIAVDTTQVRTATPELDKLAAAGNRAEAAANKMGGAFSEVTGSLSRMLGPAALAAGALALITKSHASFMEAEISVKRLEATLKSTGYAAGLTAGDIDRLVDSMVKITGIDDEPIRDAARAMLVFKNVSGETFKQAMRLSADLAAQSGTDIGSVASALGMALEAPLSASRKLKGLKVDLTATEEALIKKFVEAGDAASAQGVILKKLEGIYGGIAEKMNTGPIKATNDLKLAWDELLETLGKEVEPGASRLFAHLANEMRNLKILIDDPGIINFIRFMKDVKVETPKVKSAPQSDADRAKAVAGLAAQKEKEKADARDLVRIEALEKAEKAATAAREKATSAREALTKANAEYVKGLHDEYAVLGFSTEAATLYTAAQKKLTPVQMASVKVILEKTAAFKAQQEAARANNAEFDEALAKEDAFNSAATDSIKSLKEWIAQQEFEVSLMGMSNVERQTSIQLRATETAGIDTQTESYRKLAEQAAAANSDKRGMTLLSGTQTEKTKEFMADIAAIDKLFFDLKISSEQAAEGIDLITGSMEKSTTLKDIDAYLDPAKAQSFGDALRGAFGSAGDAMAGLSDALGDYLQKSEELLKLQKALANDKSVSAEDRIKREIGLSSKQAKTQVAAYASMAGAAKGFFKANSTGYKVLGAIEKAAHLLQMANMAKEILQNFGLISAKVAGNALAASSGIASDAVQIPGAIALANAKALGAVANQGTGDPYTAFPRIAAMIAIMAGLGLMASSSSSSGGGGPTAASRQATQGRGTVLGDSDALSNSLLNSLEAMEENTFTQLKYSSGMLDALKSIQRAMVGLAQIIFRTSGLTSGNPLGIVEGAIKPGGIQGKLQGTGDPLNDWLLNGLFGKKTRTITDSGLSIVGALSDLINGQGFRQYTDVTTKKKSWFSTKTSTATIASPVSEDVSRQLGLVFAGISDSIQIAAVSFGKDSETIAAQLAASLINIPALSLRGLKGQELQDALNAVFSGAADKLSSTIIPGLESLQKVGEGYYETIIRASNSLATVNGWMERFGQNLVEVSISGAVAATSLADLFGGINEMNAANEAYYSEYFSEAERTAIATRELTVALHTVGLALPATRDGFRTLVEAQDLMTESGRSTYAVLLDLAPAFSEITTAVAALAETNRGWLDQLAILTGTETERSLALRDATDETTRALMRQVYAQQDLAAAVTTATGNANTAISALQTSVNAEKALLQTAFTAASAALNKTISAIGSVLSSLDSTIDRLRSSVQPANIASRTGADWALQQVLISLKGGASITKFADTIASASSVLGQDGSRLYATFADYARAQAKSSGILDQIRAAGGVQLSAAEQQLKMLEAAFKAEIAALDQLVVDAQTELDALLGINTSVLSVADAVLAVNASIGALAGAISAVTAAASAIPSGGAVALNPVGTSYAGMGSDIKTIQDLYSVNLGRVADAAGLQYWTDQFMGDGVISEAEKQQFAIAAIPEYQSTLPQLADGTNYVPKDMTARLHQGEAVVPRKYNVQGAGGDTGRMEALLERMIEKIGRLEAASASTARHTAKTAKTLERAMPDGDALAVRTAA